MCTELKSHTVYDSCLFNANGQCQFNVRLHYEIRTAYAIQTVNMVINESLLNKSIIYLHPHLLFKMPFQHLETLAENEIFRIHILIIRSLN